MSQNATPQSSQPPKICLDPADLDFGTMEPDASQTLQTSIRNCGGQQLQWSTDGGGLELDVKAGTLDSNQSQPIKVTLNTGSVKLNPGPNRRLVHFNSSDGSSMNLKVTVKKRWRWPVWTGFGRKTFWDWLQLLAALAIPIVIAAGTTWFSYQQNQVSLQIAQDQQREAAIKSYLDSMSTLLENPDLRDPQKGVEVRSLARAQTLAILRELGTDGVRKAVVIHFLHDSGLLVRDPFPIVSLAGADLSRAELRNVDLGGADLAGANLTRTNLTNAYLIGAYLSQARLNGANLTGARLDYTSLTGADLSCADPGTCTNLTGADLGGADLTGANLNGAIFKQTDISGTNPQNMFTRWLKNGGVITTAWKVIREDTNTLLIAYNEGSLLPPYGRLDLNTSKLQLNYGPLGNWGTSIVLFPALWSKTSCPSDYCETAPVTSYSSDSNLSDPTSFQISVRGTIAGLQIGVELTFYQPKQNSISVGIAVQASSPTPVGLDQETASGALLQNEAFKPVILRAMYDTPDQWSVQKAALGNQLPAPLSQNERTTSTNVSTFELVGGTSGSVTNAPTIAVTLTDPGAAVTLEVKPGSAPGVDNVSMWAGVDRLLGGWSYKVVASMPSITLSASAMQEKYHLLASLSPVLDDPLTNNTAGNHWDENADCRFVQGAYQVDGGEQHVLIPPDGDIFYTTCAAQTTYFSDFAYQIQMEFTKSGCAGLIFRADLPHDSYDIFKICNDGSYSYTYPESTPEGLQFIDGPGGTSAAFRTQLNQSNTITAIAIGNSIGFFVNQQYLMTVDDQSGSSQGQIGVIVYNPSPVNTAEVVYSNATVWDVSANTTSQRQGNSITNTWSVSKNGAVLQIGYGSGTNFPQYAALDLSSGYFRMVYSTTSQWGASLLLLPALWSNASCPTDYCQGAPISATWQTAGANLKLSIQGTIATLQVVSTVTLMPPANNIFVAQVSTTVTGTVTLDQRPGEAFKPVMLSSMHISSTQWDSQAAFIGTQTYSFPSSGWIIQPPLTAQTFGLQGGTSTWKTNAPTIEVNLDQGRQITGWVTQSSDPNGDNVGFWCATDNVLPSWSFKVIAKAS